MVYQNRLASSGFLLRKLISSYHSKETIVFTIDHHYGYIPKAAKGLGFQAKGGFSAVERRPVIRVFMV